VKRSDLAGWAGYGYCASHSRFFWGLRLYLVCTPTGMPMLWALANPKLDEREVLTAMLDRESEAVTSRPGLLLIADKGFASKAFEADLTLRGAELLRPSFKREKRPKGESLLKSVRQLIRSVNDTLKGRLDLEQHGGRTFEGVAVRVAQRVLALAGPRGARVRCGPARVRPPRPPPIPPGCRSALPKRGCRRQRGCGKKSGTAGDDGPSVDHGDAPWNSAVDWRNRCPGWGMW
jgi:hypothetical protein